MTAKRKTLKMKQFKCFCTTYACTIPRASAIRFRMPYGRMQRGTASPSRPYKITCYIILENPLLLASTNASIYREMYIIKHPRLDRKDDCYLCPVVVMSIVSDTQYLHSPPPLWLHFSSDTPNLSKSSSFHRGTPNTPRGGGQFQNPQTRNSTSGRCVWYPSVDAFFRVTSRS